MAGSTSYDDSSDLALAELAAAADSIDLQPFDARRVAAAIDLRAVHGRLPRPRTEEIVIGDAAAAVVDGWD